MPNLDTQPAARPGEALLRAGIRPVPAGEFFRECFIAARGARAAQVADAMQLDRATLDAFLENRVRVDLGLANKLATFTGTSVAFWLNMQAAADLAETWPEAGP